MPCIARWYNVINTVGHLFVFRLGCYIHDDNIKLQILFVMLNHFCDMYIYLDEPRHPPLGASDMATGTGFHMFFPGQGFLSLVFLGGRCAYYGDEVHFFIDFVTCVAQVLQYACSASQFLVVCNETST